MIWHKRLLGDLFTYIANYIFDLSEKHGHTLWLVSHMYLQWNLSKAATQRKTQKYVLKTNNCLMQVKNYAFDLH